MERDPQFRYARVVMIVEWDPETQDHPYQWDWEYLLGVRDQVLEVEDVTEQQENLNQEE